MLYLQQIHEGVEYFKPNRSRLESLPAAKNRQGGLGDSEDESDAKIFSVPDSKTGQQSAPHIQLELMPRQPQQSGTMIEFLSKIILTETTSVITTAMCRCTIITLLDDSKLNVFQTFWPRLNNLRLVDVPGIIHACNFRSADSRVSLSNFSSTKFTNGVHAM